MKKLIFVGMAMAMMSIPVLAQELDLFPELQGQFEQIAPEPDDEAAENEMATGEQKKEDQENPDKAKGELTEEQMRTKQALEENTTGEKHEGNLKIQLQNLNGALPYVKSLAYCYGDAVLTNETNRDLQGLSLKLTYGDMATDVNYSGVPKKKQQKQSILLIGPPCEQILGIPQMDIVSCKMKDTSEDACKKRVQFVSPNG